MTSNESEKTKLCYQNDLKRITKDNSHGITSKSGDFEIDQENRENIDPLLMKVSPPKIQNKPDANDISPYRSRKRKRDEVDTDDEDDIVGPGWELLDPTPNVHDLFETFNRRFFKSKLVNVQVRWHKDDPTRTASCRNYSDGTIKIALNENLLSLRTRRDLVEVLLVSELSVYAFQFLNYFRKCFSIRILEARDDTCICVSAWDFRTGRRRAWTIFYEYDEANQQRVWC